MSSGILAPLAPDAALVTLLDGHPATHAWLGAVRGQRVVPLGPDHFGQSGDIPDLYREYRLDTDAILDACAQALLDTGIGLSGAGGGRRGVLGQRRSRRHPADPAAGPQRHRRGVRPRPAPGGPALRRRRTVRALLIRAEGPAFTVGGDVAMFARTGAADLPAKLHAADHHLPRGPADPGPAGGPGAWRPCTARWRAAASA